MDNQNDPNSQNSSNPPVDQNSNPSSFFGSSSSPTPPPQPDPIQNQPVTDSFNTGTAGQAGWPTPVESAPVESTTPWTPPVQSAPDTSSVWPASNASHSDAGWPTPVQTDTAPLQTPPPVPEPTPLSETTPTPTFTPPSSIPAPLANVPETNSSPLNNPWGAPTQSPTVDSSSAPTEPSWMNTAPTESTPTDLSHLISSNSPTETSAPVLEMAPSTITAAPDVPNIPTEIHKGIPKWVIGLGIGLLLLVIGASAYFILGIGQPSKPTTSLPAITQTPVPVAAPTSQPTTAPVASGSANFGELQGNGNTQQATSAAELLRQRQQGK